MNVAEVSRIIALTMEYWPSSWQPSQTTHDAWLLVLGKIDYGVARDAVVRMSVSGAKFYPRPGPGDIVTAIEAAFDDPVESLAEVHRQCLAWVQDSEPRLVAGQRVMPGPAPDDTSLAARVYRRVGGHDRLAWLSPQAGMRVVTDGFNDVHDEDRQRHVARQTEELLRGTSRAIES